MNVSQAHAGQWSQLPPLCSNAGKRRHILAAEGLRKIQLNVRVTPEEKLIFEQAARQSGQRLSDFIRAAALAGAVRGQKVTSFLFDPHR